MMGRANEDRTKAGELTAIDEAPSTPDVDGWRHAGLLVEKKFQAEHKADQDSLRFTNRNEGDIKDIKRCKGHLVDRGFPQHAGVVFLEAFNLVIGFDVVCTVLIISATRR